MRKDEKQCHDELVTLLESDSDPTSCERSSVIGTLPDVGNSFNAFSWANATQEDAREFLIQKGYLEQLAHQQPSRPIIEYLIGRAVDVVEFALERPLSWRSDFKTSLNFLLQVIARADVWIGEILVALVYVERAKAHLQIAIEEWAIEGLFLDALVVASKDIMTS
ncbi:hypothetical protein B0H13DRAFT_2350727 [Mycena leptocephala]|nr:hypothetical protein B0H13DRAFT_2350727 [Mycena leptocephala]